MRLKSCCKPEVEPAASSAFLAISWMTEDYSWIAIEIPPNNSVIKPNEPQLGLTRDRFNC